MRWNENVRNAELCPSTTPPTPPDSAAGRGRFLRHFRVCSTRFATLAWSGMANKQVEYPYGLIAGGMGDGTVNIWDPAKLVASHPQPQVPDLYRYYGTVPQSIST